MKNIFKISLTTILFLFSFPILLASADTINSDTDNGGGGISLPTIITPKLNCHISQGAKICKTCKSTDNIQPIKQSTSINNLQDISSSWTQCQSCTQTHEPLVPNTRCKSNDECVLVKADCCGGPCRPTAVHKSQVGSYNARLKKECNPPYVYEEKGSGTGGISSGSIGGIAGGGGISQCMCGSMEGYTPEYAAVCREHIYATKPKTVSSLQTDSKPPVIKYCSVLEFLPQPLPKPKKGSEAIQ